MSSLFLSWLKFVTHILFSLGYWGWVGRDLKRAQVHLLPSCSVKRQCGQDLAGSEWGGVAWLFHQFQQQSVEIQSKAAASGTACLALDVHSSDHRLHLTGPCLWKGQKNKERKETFSFAFGLLLVLWFVVFLFAVWIGYRCAVVSSYDCCDLCFCLLCGLCAVVLLFRSVICVS